MTVDDILKENAKRTAKRCFDPITGEGSSGNRFALEVADFETPRMWLPTSMESLPIVRRLREAGSFSVLAGSDGGDMVPMLKEVLLRERCRHDFPFWCAMFVFIKPKGGGADVLFRLNRPQLMLIEEFERQRLAGKPIRIILLKARQWGGSTVTQVYMAWLQLVHATGLNSLIVGHVRDSSVEVKGMFDRLLSQYPAGMLAAPWEGAADGMVEMEGVEGSANVKRIPSRLCKIKIGTAERPDSARGGDYNLVHLTEVGMWRSTEGKSPADIVRSATSGVLLAPLTMIVYESTANGTGNFFAEEYAAAKSGESQFTPVFIPWFAIEAYTSRLADQRRLAQELLAGRLSESTESNRKEPGKYLWWLWEIGASLEAISWYVNERRKYSDHGEMASEYPTDDVEAFVHSGSMVFDKYAVEAMRRTCRPADEVGEVAGGGRTGKAALTGIHFTSDAQGGLHVWAKPDTSEDEVVSDRYLVVVDIGGRGRTSDWSVIAVFDRIGQMDGFGPVVVAQWRGHIDMDVLAWKAAQVATWYDNALLIIESNTIETRDRERDVDGDHSQYLLSQLGDVYPNLYARKQPEDKIVDGAPTRYGFHTNVATKPMIIDSLIVAVRDRLYTERDTHALDELLAYERKPNGSYGAIPGRHDDILMTRAIGLHIAFNEMPLPRALKPGARTDRIKWRRSHSDRTEAMI